VSPLKAYKGFGLLNHRCKYIFSIIQKKGPISKSDLINITKLKLTTLNRELKILMNEKIIVESDIGESTGGRKPSLYDVNLNKFYIIGIDISRIYARIVITNLKLNIIEEELLNHDYDIKGISVIMPSIIKKLSMKLPLENSWIVGIGIGIVGGFDIKPLYDTLTKETNVPIHIDNGANAAVIGEYHFGLGKDKQNIAYVNCGMGIRTGIISSGVLIRTINNLEDAFGHMIVDAKGELCSCGNYGCLESYTSVAKITKDFINKAKEHKDLGINKALNEIGYEEVCSLAEKNNKDAITCIKNAAVYLGIGLSNYIKLFNPELIILSGPLIQHSKLFYETAKEIALQKCHIKNNNIQFSCRGYFSDKSIAVGACAMIIQEIQKSKDLVS
jgi:predicted NBD/HSP70 family sugar kinase